MQTRGYRGKRSHVWQERFAPRQPISRGSSKIPSALGPMIRNLVPGEIDDSLEHDLSVIKDCEFVASYNLMDGLSKTILVPGRPPIWTPSLDTMKLSADSGIYYRDENAARFPEYPFEPVVRSIFHMNLSFDSLSFDVVACGSTLGNLLRSVQGKGESFSFVAHTVGRTAFFVRRGLSSTELIEDVQGYGHSFVEANTTWSRDVKGSSSHQRVIAYRLGSKRMLVRFEADSYTMDQADELGASEDANDFPTTSSSELDALTDMLLPRVPAPAADKVIILQKGSHTTQPSTIDIKTRAHWKQRDVELAEQLPRLWLRQINNIVLSFHDKGTFDGATVEDVSSMIADWEVQNQKVIARFSSLIDIIISAAGQADGGKLEVRCDKPTYLQLHVLSPQAQSRWHAIPDNLCKLWTKK